MTHFVDRVTDRGNIHGLQSAQTYQSNLQDSKSYNLIYTFVLFILELLMEVETSSSRDDFFPI